MHRGPKSHHYPTMAAAQIYERLEINPLDVKNNFLALFLSYGHQLQFEEETRGATAMVNGDVETTDVLWSTADGENLAIPASSSPPFAI